MGADGVEHDAEGEDVGAHDEDEEGDLGGGEELAAEGTHDDFAGFGEGVDVGLRG